MTDDAPADGEPPSAAELLVAEIKRFRGEAGLSQRDLARRSGYTREYVSMAERPGNIPSHDLVRALDSALDAGGALADLRAQAKAEQRALRNGLQTKRDADDQTDGLTRTVSADLARMASAANPVPDDYVGGEEDDVKRRTLLSLLGQAAVVSPLVERLEEARRGLDGILISEPTNRDADDWEQAAATYATEVGTVQAGQLLGELVADFEEIKLRITDARELVRTRLVHTGSHLAALTAISLVNLGEPRSAERWWRTASRAAEGTRDPELAALVRGRHAIFSLHTAPPTRVLALADAAVAHGKNRPCVGVISGLAARAQVLSRDGRQAEANTVLCQVIDMFEQLPSAALGKQHNQWNWAEQRLRHVESYVHAYAGRADKAQTAQGAAIACYPSNSFQGRTQVALHQAIALIRSGDVLGGAHHVVSIFDRLELWQREDGLVLRTAEAALNTIPREERGYPQVKAANEMLQKLVGR